MRDGYKMWLDYCLNKYNQEYNDNRNHYDAEKEPFGVEFSEEGGIYLHGTGGTNQIGKNEEYSLFYYNLHIHNWENW